MPLKSALNKNAINNKRPGLNNVLARVISATFLLISATVSVPTVAEELVGNVADFGNAELKNWSQIYVDIAMGLGQYLPGDTLTTQVRPFARSIREVSQNIADFHVPLICSEKFNKDLPYDFASEPLGPIDFSLYTRKDRPLTKQDLMQARYELTELHLNPLDQFTQQQKIQLKAIPGSFTTQNGLVAAAEKALKQPLSEEQKQALTMAAFPYHIETDRIHTKLLQAHPVHPYTSVKSSIRKLVAGRIDGFISSSIASEYVMTTEHLENKVSKEFYEEYYVCFVIAKNTRGGSFDRKLSNAIAQFKASGEYDILIADFVRKLSETTDRIKKTDEYDSSSEDAERQDTK